MNVPPCLADLEQRRLQTLTSLAEAKRLGDALCEYCGIRSKYVGQICEACDARRDRLQAKYPAIRVERPMSPEEAV